MKNAISLVLIILSISCKPIANKTRGNADAQKESLKVKNELYNWVENRIDSTMKARNIPAISIGIVKNEKLVYARGFGVYERETDRSVDENSLYQIGSDSKKFTAIIVRNLVSEGKLTLNESIISYLPEISASEAKEKLKKITVKDLLLHNSGIPTIAPSNKRVDGDPMLVEYTEKNLLHDLNTIKLDFEPQTNFGYSNFGYAVLGFICERTSGQPYPELIKKYVTDKLAMNSTFITPDKRQLNMIVTPYRKDDRNVKSAPWQMGKMTPAGGIYSNVTDISRLMIAQMKAYREFTKTGEKNSPLILTEIDGRKGDQYGFGLALRIDEKGTRYGHGGDLDGYASGYVFLLEPSVGLIMLTSSGGRWFGELEHEIRDKLIGNMKSADPR